MPTAKMTANLHLVAASKWEPRLEVQNSVEILETILKACFELFLQTMICQPFFLTLHHDLIFAYFSLNLAFWQLQVY
jgi:hypothetical protein